MIRHIDAAVSDPSPALVMEEVTDPVEIAAARARREQFDRNWEWLSTHGPALYEANRGKFIGVAGQEFFSADTVEEVIARAEAAHPQDRGLFTLYVPTEKAVRVYAGQR